MAFIPLLLTVITLPTIISRSVLLRMRNDSYTSCTANQNTLCLFSNLFFENLVIYEIMWKNIVQPDTPQMTVWRMLIACWISKAKNTPSEYELFTAFPLQQRLHERALMLGYTYFACLVHFLRACSVSYSLIQRFSNFFQVGTTFIRMFYGPPYSWDYQTN